MERVPPLWVQVGGVEVGRAVRSGMNPKKLHEVRVRVCGCVWGERVGETRLLLFFFVRLVVLLVWCRTCVRGLAVLWCWTWAQD